MNQASVHPEVPGLERLRSGKVRDVYGLGTSLLIVASDRISAFDVIMGTGIPDKGCILNQMSAFWFEKLNHVCPSHIITAADTQISQAVPGWHSGLAGRCTLAKKAEPLAIECVARGFIAGSLYKEYAAAPDGKVRDLELPPGLLDGSRLPEPLFTPATKALEGHDENISFNQAVDIVGKEAAAQVMEWTLTLYAQAAAHAASCGLILADTKFEFGWTEDGLIWIDEALTPDSSRYWEAAEWQPGGAQPSFDKQYLRDWLEASGWSKSPPGPELPPEVAARTRDKYAAAFQRITGRAFA